jgi:hypothetical protein
MTTTIRFGPDGQPRHARRFALTAVLFAAVVAGYAGWQLAGGVASAPWRLLMSVVVVIGAGIVLVAAVIVVIESRARAGRSVGPDGVSTWRGAFSWTAITRASIHTGAGGRRLLAVWPAGSTGPVWLGAADRASVPLDEAIRLVEQWSGRRVEDS